MTLNATRGTVTTEATLLASAPEAIAGIGQTEVGVRVPTGGSAVYVGGDDVTSSTGFAVNGGELFSVALDPTEALYGITASGSQVVHVVTSSNRAPFVS